MKVQVGHLYIPNGSFKVIKPGNGKKFTLEELQKAVGGYLQKLHPGLKGCHTMYCDEDGISKRLPPNPHTWSVINANVYERSVWPNGSKMYPRDTWRVLGNILAILNVPEEKQVEGK